MRFLVLSISFLILFFTQAQVTTGIDSLVQAEMKSRRIPGMAVAVIRNKEVIHENTYGLSVIEHQVQVESNTRFELASLTKQFVASGVLLLTQEGALELDKPIQHYIDTLPPIWQKLTLRQLLSHTAGLAPQDQEFASLRPWPKYVSRHMLWEAAINDSTYWESGTKFRYHNFGYFLALLTIEHVTRQNYQDFFHERIFAPSGLRNTYFESQIRVNPNQAQGYTIKNDELVKIWRVSQEEMAGGWGIWSTLEDMIQWCKTLDENALLNPTIQNELFKPIKLENNNSFHYGLGWFLPERNGITYHYHNGITGPEILRIPSHDITIITLSNLGIGVGLMTTNEPEPFGIADIIASEILPEFKFNPQTLPIKADMLLELEGSFSFEYDDDVKFQSQNGKLYILDIYGKDEMIHTGNNVFTFSELPATYYHFINSDSIIIKEDIWQNDTGIRKH